MNPEPEIRRLLDLLPASGRMMSKLVSKPEQPKVIESELPLPWTRERLISINFDLWSQLNKPQRDLTILRTVSWQGSVRWFKPDLYKGLGALGLFGTVVELVQQDAIGILMAGGLTAIAATQVWRNSRSSRLELEADEAALRVAERRGYSPSEAARSLFSAVEAVAKIEGRPSLSFTELVRCQNLKAIAGISAIGVPESYKQES